MSLLIGAQCSIVHFKAQVDSLKCWTWRHFISSIFGVSLTSSISSSKDFNSIDDVMVTTSNGVRELYYFWNSLDDRPWCTHQSNRSSCILLFCRRTIFFLSMFLLSPLSRVFLYFDVFPDRSNYLALIYFFAIECIGSQCILTKWPKKFRIFYSNHKGCETCFISIALNLECFNIKLSDILPQCFVTHLYDGEKTCRWFTHQFRSHKNWVTNVQVNSLKDEIDLLFGSLEPLFG